MAPISCIEPTEAIVEISTDALCSDVSSTGITPGLLGEIEAKPFSTTTSQCTQGGEVGSIVLLPPEGEENAKFAFKVVMSLGEPIESCVAPDYGPNCIVARRAMRFAPNLPFHVPVRMSLACAGVTCPSDQSCVEGTCRSASLDADTCSDPGGCLPEGGPALPFNNHYSFPGAQFASDIALGLDGTLAVAGNFQSDLDLGGGMLPSKGDQDMFLATYSASGAFRWSVAFGDVGLDDGSAVAIDRSGDIYLLGLFSGAVDFGGGTLKSSGATDLALVKISSFGKVRWAIKIGDTSGDFPGQVAVDPAGNVYVVGALGGTTTIENIKLTSAGGQDGFLASFTRAGELRWARSFGGVGDDYANGVSADTDGNVYVTGSFAMEANVGGPTPLASAGAGDVYITSFDQAGTFRWAKSFGSGGNDLGIDVDARGQRVVVGGELGGNATLDGTPLAGSNGEGFVATFDTAGKLAWASVIGGPGDGRTKSVSIAPDGSVVVSGEIDEGSAFGSEAPTLGGMHHPFVAVLEATGEPRWSKLFSTSLYGYASSVAASPTGSVYFAGWFADTIDFGDGLVKSGGLEDMLLMHIAAP
jgi:hypothetical protein